jgi:hypothetical protein
MASRTAIANMYRTFVDAFGTKLHIPSVETWLEDLEEFDDETVARAAKAWRQGNQYPPKIYEMVQYCKRNRTVMANQGRPRFHYGWVPVGGMLVFIKIDESLQDLEVDLAEGA